MAFARCKTDNQKRKSRLLDYHKIKEFLGQTVNQDQNLKWWDDEVSIHQHRTCSIGTMEFEAGYSFSAAPAVAGCSNPTATTKRSKRSTETEVVVTVSGETLREAGDMSLKVDQVTPHFRLIDWVYYCRVARRHVFGINIFESW